MGFPQRANCDHPLQEDRSMPTLLSLDVRHRLQRLIEDGSSSREATRHLLISAATGVRLAAKVRRGEGLLPRKCGYSVGQRLVV